MPPEPVDPVAKIQRVCATCGMETSSRGNNCVGCARDVRRDEMIDIANQGRVLADTPEANAERVEKQAKQWAARRAWKPESQLAWLAAKFYFAEIQPRLVTITVPEIAAALSISEAYAADIRAGRHR